MAHAAKAKGGTLRFRPLLVEKEGLFAFDGLQGGNLYRLVGGVVARAQADKHRKDDGKDQQPGGDYRHPVDPFAPQNGGGDVFRRIPD